MRELDSILSTWAECEAHQGGGILATVVDVKGSAYRHPGARMLMTSDGKRIGSISGGCLEGDLAKKSWWWTRDGQPVLRVYDSTADDDGAGEFGLGCNGVVRVLLERLDTPSARTAIAFLNVCRAERKTGAMSTVISSPSPEVARVGDRWFLEPNGSTGGNIRDLMVRDWVEAESDAALRERRSHLLVVPHSCGDVEVFVEVIAPPVPLLVFGAGSDAVPLVRLAKELGWHVTVADGRPSLARAQRFPDGDCVVLTQPLNPLANIAIEPESVIVVMNHNYVADRDVLAGLLASRPAYVGMLGPRLRTERILRELNVIQIPDWLHAPAGLDIGCETPASIALSILAEIQTVVSGRTAKMLRSAESQPIALCA